MVGNFIWEPRLLPVVSKTFNGLPSHIIVVSHLYPLQIAGELFQNYWTYQWRSTLTPDFRSMQHLWHSGISTSSGDILKAHVSRQDWRFPGRAKSLPR